MVRLAYARNCKVSVVIRTRDLERLPELLRMLAAQTVRPAQLIVVDNYSCERSLRNMQLFLLKAKKVLFTSETSIKLVALPDKFFSHAHSTNLGVYHADNEFVCITNGHSLPISRRWLEDGLTHFRDPMVAGVCGYFLPSSSASLWEKLYPSLWNLQRKITNIFRKNFYFSTINCILRKSLWEKYPFDENLLKIIPNSRKYGGEDYDWGLEMLARNYKIIVDPKFNVYHSHGESFKPSISKLLMYNRIQKSLKCFKRPRKSFTMVFKSKSRFFNLR